MFRIEMKDGGRTGFFLSLFLHLSVPALLLVFSFSLPKSPQGGGGTLVDLSGLEQASAPNPGNTQDPMSSPSSAQADDESSNEETGETGKNTSGGLPVPAGPEQIFGNAWGNADTSGLGMVYSENTLNVRVRYPAGWKYVDQNRKKKLDGVSFMGPEINGIVPYMIIEVKDKNLFNPKRYLYHSELPKYSVHFNEPEELEGQISYTAYIRTNTSEDYSLKMIINGRENFNAFKPLFFAMLKSFSYGYF